jgi:DNA-3-methyladenine glycosylase
MRSDHPLLPLPPGRVLGSEFFARPSDEVGYDLIGKVLWRPGIGGGRVTEVEAYLPEADPASHAALGPTKRNAAMFGSPGTIYVFLSYGVHHLLNVVTDGHGTGSAVLIRAFEALDGQASAAARCGPGRVGKALQIGPGLNCLPLGEASGIFLLDDGSSPRVGVTTRIGISRGTVLPLRYYSFDSTCVSRTPSVSGGSGP